MKSYGKNLLDNSFDVTANKKKNEFFVLEMNDKIKIPGLSNPESYFLTHSRFITYMVLFFTDLNKAQIYKMPYRDSPHHEVEILMSLGRTNTVKIITLENRITKILYSKLEIKIIFMWEKNYLVLKQAMKLWKILRNMDLTLLNSQLLTVKKTFTSCYIKNIFFFKKMKIQQQKNEYQYLYKKRWWIKRW